MMCARDRDELSWAERRLGTDGAEVASVACDLTTPDAPAQIMAAVHERFSPLELLVNNAGIIQVGPFDALREEDFRRAMETMLFAPLRLTTAALPDLRQAESGNNWAKSPAPFDDRPTWDNWNKKKK